MAHNVEPMDLDSIEGDFDNKENAYHHSNVLPRTPCTEKGYEELDVSELNMKLRYSITPASSPMSKSYTAHCLDNKNLESPENIINFIDNANLTRSFNSTLTKNESLSKTKLQPLQLHTADASLDNNRNISVLRPLDTTAMEDGDNITVTVTGANDIDENLSVPSSSSSALHTPEATTPIKEIPRHDGGSPIMRGLKSVLNMFRASQSPIPTAESEDNAANHDISSPVELVSNATSDKSQIALASTPIAARKQKETSSKRGSPLKESIIFNEDLKKELLWKDETTILFSEEKIPIHKLFFQQSKNMPPISKDSGVPIKAPVAEDSLNESVEFMDVSFNDSIIENKTISKIPDAPPSANVAESDSEFVDCETTFAQQSDDEQHTEPDKEKTISETSINKSAQELQVITTDVSDNKLDATIAKETQNIHELTSKNIPEPVNTTVSVESKDTMSQDISQEIETKIDKENVIAPVDGTILIQAEDKLSSTFMNAIQDIRTQMPNEITQVLHATIDIDSDNTFSSSAINNAIQSIEVISSVDETKPANITVSTESIDKHMSVSSFILNTTQNVTQFAVEQLNTTAAIEDKPVSASTFIMNATQNIESPLVIEKKECLNVTKDLSSTFIMNETQNNGIAPVSENINEGLNLTKNLDEPISSSTFLMNETKIMEAQSKPENATVIIKSDEVVPIDVNNISQVIASESTKRLDATVTTASVFTPVPSSTFTMNTTKNVDSYLTTGKKNELLDATVTIDTKDMSAPSTFIKDVTQVIKSPMTEENIRTPLDSTVLVDSENKLVPSSTFIKNISPDVEKESLGVTIATETISSSTFTKDITQDFESQAGVSDNNKKFNATIVTEVIPLLVEPSITEIDKCARTENLDVTLSAEKSMTSFVNFKDVTHKIIDPEIIKKCNKVLNTVVTDRPTKSEENNFARENPLFSDTLKTLNATVTVETLEAMPILPQDIAETEISSKTVCVDTKDSINSESSQSVNLPDDFVDQTGKQTVSDQFIPKEIVEVAEQVDSVGSNPINPDLLNSTGNVANAPTDIIKERILNIDDVSKTIEIHKDKDCAEHVPANIPLPDEDDLEIEPLKAVQESVINNSANLSVLPDVINDLDSTKVQGSNRVDEVPLSKLDHSKGPADLITDALTNKEIINESEIHNENNDIDSTDKLNVEKDILPKNRIELELSVENIDEQRKFTELEIPVTISEDQLELMDISYSGHNISLQKDSEVTTSNITIAVQSENTDFGLNEKKSDICVQSEMVCFEAKIEPAAIIASATTYTDMNALHNMSVDDMEIDVATGINVTGENKDTVELSHALPNKKGDIAAKKEVIHEEIIVSENNSPYVYVSVDKDTDNKFDSSLEEDFEKIENPLACKSKISPSLSASPPIASKGYNFNFDEIDNPFATITKIRASPPLDSPKQTLMPQKSEAKKEVPKKEPLNKNKRKSFPVRPKSVITKKNFNSTFDGSLPTQNNTVNEKCEFVSNDSVDIKHLSNRNETEYVTAEEFKISPTNTEESDQNVVEKSELENNTDNTSKVLANVDNTESTSFDNKSSLTSTTPSSSDQSVYLSAATSSGDSISARNVFNLPEIHDTNFNPFATISKMRQSPPPSVEVSVANISQSKSDTTVTLYEGNLSEKENVTIKEDNLHNFSENKSGHDDKDSSNANNVTSSSKDDKNTTVREVHTDSEDTIEGPFLEAEDNEIVVVSNNIKDDDFTALGLQNDMMLFSDLPTQDNEDNELFIDAAAYEFLLNQNKNNMVADSGKESLFLKFDPLFAKRLSSEGIAAALSKIQKRQSTPKKMSKPPEIVHTNQADPGPSTSKVSPQLLNTTEDIAEDLNVTTSKPMMVVTPAVNQIVTPRKSTTPSSNRRSITFTSPAIAVIDRLLSMSANSSLVDQNTTITEVNREQNEADMALVQLRELLAEKEINVYNLRSESKELKDRLTTLESQMQALEAESEQRLKKINELTNKLTEKTKINKSMAAVVEEYERTIASLIAETEQDRKRHAEERERLIKERDEQMAHLASMEVSFNDLHSKYEKSKQIILSCKANEDTYKKSIKDFEENLMKMQNNYELLKQHATSKLNHANQELEKMNRAHESEVLKLNAMIKRKELHITSLEETLMQKTKANEELTAICDELINKVG